MRRIHYTHQYLLNPTHKITVDLVGLGGTGSQVLNGLARINESLMALNHPGLHVRAWDMDVVELPNIGRQLFSHADLGLNKALVLVTRVNRFFGTEWEARPVAYTGKETSNILITCVDSAKARIDIGKVITSHEKFSQPVDDLMYWMDIGNLQKTGQVVLGSFMSGIHSPKKTDGNKIVAMLPTVIKMFPQLKKIKEEQQGPSCSLAEALQKQDLFINSTLAQFGCNLIWKLIMEGSLTHHGCYVNMENLIVNPIKV